MRRYEYDVFLSHTDADREIVRQIGERLRRVYRLRVFLDEWHLVPGEPWQEAVEDALANSRSCAVFLGPSGVGPWENEEMRCALENCVGVRHFRVIPILLPGLDANDPLVLPPFLKRLYLGRLP